MNFFSKINNVFDEFKKIYKEGGIRLLLKKKGFSIVLIVFFYYLVRDSFLYIILPFFVFKNLTGCF